MAYAVKERFYTLQGEGANSGRAAVFLRFAGCNLWSGREADRARAICQFCDTDFVGVQGDGGGHFASAAALAQAVEQTWQAGAQDAILARDRRFVVCTGGEPLLQVDAPLLQALHALHFQVAVETNGTQPVPTGTEAIDWLCVSPKAGAALVLHAGDELKLVFPQRDAEPSRYADLSFRHFFLQPMDGPQQQENTALAAAYCMAHPQWRLSLQSHKLIGLR